MKQLLSENALINSYQRFVFRHMCRQQEPESMQNKERFIISEERQSLTRGLVLILLIAESVMYRCKQDKKICG